MSQSNFSPNKSSSANTPAPGDQLCQQALSAARAQAQARGWQPLGLAAATGDELEQLHSPVKKLLPANASTGPVFSSAHSDERDPMLVSVAVPALARQRQWYGRTALADVLARWSQMVGSEVAAHCQPESVHEQVLTVRADSTAWALQMRLLSASVLEAINRCLREELSPEEGKRSQEKPGSISTKSNSLTDSPIPDAQVWLVKEVKVLGPQAPSWKRGRLQVPGRGPRDTYG